MTVVLVAGQRLGDERVSLGRNKPNPDRVDAGPEVIGDVGFERVIGKARNLLIIDENLRRALNEA